MLYRIINWIIGGFIRYIYFKYIKKNKKKKLQDYLHDENAIFNRYISGCLILVFIIIIILFQKC